MTVLAIIAPAGRSRFRLAILWIILMAWVMALIVLYFTTVRPRQRSLLSMPQHTDPTCHQWQQTTA